MILNTPNHASTFWSILFASAFSLLVTVSVSAAAPDGGSRYRTFAPDGVPVRIAENAWEMDQHGNHRAVVEVSGEADAVCAVLPWRRPDLRIETKKIKVTDAQDNEIKDVAVLSMTSDEGTVAFRPTAGPGTYYIYYLPCVFRRGWNDARYGKPWNDYLAPEYEADAAWASKVSSGTSELPKAKLTAFESISPFDFWSPMGLAATEAETAALKAAVTGDFAVFPEDRAFPIQFGHKLPAKWAEGLPKPLFKGLALRDEYYVWQLGVWAAKKDLSHVKVEFSDFRKGGAVIPSSEFTCFNQEGISWDGSEMAIDVNVPQDRLQALWCGVMIPADARPGVYKGTATVTAENAAPKEIAVRIKVKAKTIEDHGDAETWRHSRLRWLNSTIALDNEPTRDFNEMTLEGKTVGATGREVRLGENGLPESITINGKGIIASPVKFVVSTAKGDVAFEAASGLEIAKKAAGLVAWTSSSEKDGISFKCAAEMEFDGTISYKISVSAPEEQSVKDIRLVTGYSAYVSEYYMGCGASGGLRPTDFSWNWDGPYDSYWIGNTLAGMHVEFRGGTYHGPLIADYKPAPTPLWSNGGKGSVSVKGARGSAATVVASTGASTIGPEAKTFEFDMLITPVKTIDTAKHFSDRYFHAKPDDFDKAAELGANINVIHHATALNPYINYPFLIRQPLKDHLDYHHERGRSIHVYYTVRELTTHCEEVYAFMSMNHEIFSGGVGYGLPWETEHLIEDYRPAWYTSLEEFPGYQPDAALVLTGNSRFINYWLEGLRWMLDNYGIDGIYMDDVSFDRTTVKRIRKILDSSHDGARIDMHSNTGYSRGPANQYTDFFPYVNRIRFGECFKYDEMTADEWFVTYSGIPFGQMSEMVGGNRFLGLVYGTTARHKGEFDEESDTKSMYQASAGNFTSPAPVWKLWKEFGIEQSKMLGYWEPECPVSTSDPEVKATAYVKDDAVMVSLGNFATSDKTVKLNVDWKALGFDPAKAKAVMPEIKNFQEGSQLTTDIRVSIRSKEGAVVIISQ